MRPRFIAKGTKLQDSVYNVPLSRNYEGSTGQATGLLRLTGHGTQRGYARGCRCSPCCEAQRAYTRAYKERKNALSYSYAER